MNAADLSGPATTAHPAARPARAGRRASWRLKLLALALSLTVAFVLVEVGLRILGRDLPLVWEPEPELGWHHIPGAQRHWTEEGDGHIVINAHGFRDRERSLAKPAGTFRIA